MDGMMGQLGELVLAAGVIGTAAFGIVDGLKWLWIGRLGFGQIKNRLGRLLLLCRMRTAPMPWTFSKLSIATAEQKGICQRPCGGA